MIRWLRSQFAWRVVMDTGVWCYMENGVTGRRKIVRVRRGGHQPVQRAWLDEGR